MVVGVPLIVPLLVLKVSPAGNAGEIETDEIIPEPLKVLGVIALP
jgi:hypothetical protein